jgi:RimJ/RimL family protein N-acetyltransferase
MGEVDDKLSSAGRKRLTFKCLPVQIKDKRGRPIQVRAYEATDFEALHKMYDTFEPKGLECGLPPPDHQVRLRWLNYVVSELFNVLAIYKDRVIGHSALDLLGSPFCPEYLIFIQKGFRNLGIGTALSTIIKKAAEEAGCEKVVLTVRTANRRAIKVFEKVGFAFCGGIDTYRDMELELKRPGAGCPELCGK